MGARRGRGHRRSGRRSASRSSSCRRGCRAIPDELLEAARVDGAGAWSRFWHVTLPMLSPTIFFAVVVGSIFAFQTFGQIDLLTQGGPLKKTNVLTYFIYTTLRNAERRRQGRGARDRAVRRSRCVLDAGADPAARTAGARMSADALRARRAPATAASGTGQVGALRCCSRCSRVIVLFPIYITVVNSLLTPEPDRARSRRRSSRRIPQWGTYSRRVERRAHRHVPDEQLHRHDHHHRRPGRHRDPRRATRSRSSSSRSSARCSSCSSRR